MISRFISAGGMLWLLGGQLAYGQILTTDLELKLVPNVGAAWQTIQLENSYSDAIVVCTHNLVSASDPSAATRIRNITATSFQLRLQQFENSSIVPTSNVHCVIADEGAHDSGGLKYEARKVLSTGTSGLEVPGGWGNVNTEDVSAAITQTYANPHVVGQVMSFNDANASVFWNYVILAAMALFSQAKRTGYVSVNISDKLTARARLKPWAISSSKPGQALSMISASLPPWGQI